MFISLHFPNQKSTIGSEHEVNLLNTDLETTF